MNRIPLVLLLVVLALVFMSVGGSIAQPVATPAPAAAPAAPDLLTAIISVIATLTPIVAGLSALGLGVKYLPFMQWFPNEGIRLLNTLVAFFAAFGGGVAVAHAGILGSIIAPLGVFGKLGASFALAHMAQWFFEAHLRQPLEKLEAKGLLSHV